MEHSRAESQSSRLWFDQAEEQNHDLPHSSFVIDNTKKKMVMFEIDDFPFRRFLSLKRAHICRFLAITRERLVYFFYQKLEYIQSRGFKLYCFQYCVRYLICSLWTDLRLEFRQRLNYRINDHPSNVNDPSNNKFLCEHFNQLDHIRTKLYFNPLSKP